MGQYYRILTQDKNGKFKVYDRSVNKKYMFAKLTEHSWIGNSFMDSFCTTIINKPQRIAWIGDYAEELDNIPNEIDKDYLKTLYEMTWKKLHSNTVNRAKIDYRKYYLVNHSKNDCIDLNTYIKENTDEYGWCIHPLSLLTALGNGLGGGDYHGTNQDIIGSWCWDNISLEEKEAFDNTSFVKVMYKFKENY